MGSDASAIRYVIMFNEKDTEVGLNLAMSSPAAQTLRSYPNERLTGNSYET